MLFFFLPFTFLIFLISKRIYGRYFTPLGLYATVWGVAFVGYYVNPFGYNQPAEATNWVFVISYISFGAGCVTPFLSERRGSLKQVPLFAAENKPSYTVMLPPDRYLKLITYMGILASLVLLGASIQRYGVLTILISGMVIRSAQLYGYGMEYIQGGTDYLLFIAPRLFGLTLVYAAAALNLARFIVVGRKNHLTYLPLFGSILFDLGLQSRTHTLSMMILYGSAFLFQAQMSRNSIRGPIRFQLSRLRIRLKKKAIIRIVLIVFLCFSILTLISLSKGKFSSTRDTGVLAFGRYSVPGSVTHYFTYLTGGLATFDTVYNRPGERKIWLGRNSFNAFEYALEKAGIHLFREPTIAVTEYQSDFADTGIRGGMNIFSYLRYAWDDFGFFGFLIIPFLFGYITTRYYRKARRTFSYVDIALLLLFMNAIALSTVIFQFTNFYIFWALPLIWFARLIKIAKPKRAKSLVPAEV